MAEQDDCAAFQISGEQTIVFGSDYVRGTKFSLYELGLLSNYDIGWYLAGANLSDVAAMGAAPLGLVSVVRYPKDMQDAEFEELMRGIRDGCRAAGTENVGGDIGTAERVILSGAAMGTVEPENLLTRSGASPGQVVVLTGMTGLAGAAMKYFTRTTLVPSLSSSHLEVLLHPWRRVAPRFAHGRIFAQSSGVTACVDTSDGLTGALQALCAGSNVGIDVDIDRIPVSDSVAAAAKVLAVPVHDLVFGDSVDFELVAAVDKSAVESLISEIAAAGLELFIIGEITSGPELAGVRDGTRSQLPGEPWRHR
ncbi:hypothetical protein ATM97_23565 [Nocardia sp. MH4]|uniref:thiamine-phosphate kinase n=1 Tax=Nocardia sp. MH4 TaxID=1768677 RepID=UPI001C4F0B90|nr:thiamine-phosphate kinase [Nocardia sp. MH4]MBW0273066.1 hypothetical protein [Nocardia sp. MH4]